MGNALTLFLALISTLWTWTLIGLATFVGYQVSQEKSLGEIPGFDLLPDFLRIPLQHQTNNMIVFTLAGVLAGFLLFFLIGYVWQALQDFVRLALVRNSIERARRNGRLMRPSESNPEEIPIAWHWLYYPRMTRLWREYAETLHRQTLETLPGEAPRIQYRSTIAAETIFSTQALVDVPMRVEFFRHLPGILTGAGIVSTFAGILLGLSEFNPSVEAQQITYQLKNLFSGITTAFIASFFAIFSAILVTIIEKFLLHWRYAQIATLQHYMDDLFRAGIEPEYLAHLVHDGQFGFQQLQRELGRLTASLTAQTHLDSQTRSPSIPPLESNAQLLGKVPDNAEAFRMVLNHFLLEFSQVLNRTSETQGRRREEGRAFEIQLLSVGERLDVALGEFAHAVVSSRTEMAQNHTAMQDLLRRQLLLLERMDAHFEQTNRQLQQINREQGERLSWLERVDAHVEQTNRQLQQINQDQGNTLPFLTRLDAHLEQTNRQWQQTGKDQGSVLAWLEKVEAHMEQASRQRQQAGKDQGSLLAWLEKMEAHWEQTNRQRQQVGQDRGGTEEIATRLGNALEGQTSALQAWNHSLQEMIAQKPSEERLHQRLQETLQAQESTLQQWTNTLEARLQTLPSREEFMQWIQSEQGHQTEAWRGVHHTLNAVIGQVPDKGDMSLLLTEIRAWRTGMEEGIVHPLREATGQMADRFDTLEQEILQFKEQNAQHAHNIGLIVQQLASHFSQTLQTTLQEQPKAESGQEMAEKVAEVLFARLEQTFGTLSVGLFELRERLASERNTIVSTMEGWRADVSRTEKEKDQKIDQKISEVISHVSTHHTHLAQVIDDLNQSLSQDLDGMRDGLLSKNEESTQQMVKKVSELGRVLEEVINTVGQEQTVFIEMLGERLEALRRRLRTK